MRLWFECIHVCTYVHAYTLDSWGAVLENKSSIEKMRFLRMAYSFPLNAQEDTEKNTFCSPVLELIASIVLEENMWLWYDPLLRDSTSGKSTQWVE